MDSERAGSRVPLTVEEKKARNNHRNRVVRFRAKEEAVQYMGGKCSKCNGVFHTSAYDFHHLDPTEKDVDPGILLRGSKEKLYAELDKCILLCANCHRIHHWEEANKDTDFNVKVGPDLLEYNGENLTYLEWGERTGLDSRLIRGRILSQGWSVEKALTTPLLSVESHRRKLTYNGETKTLQEWAALYNLNVNTIRSRLGKKWDMHKVLTHPLKPWGNRSFSGKKKSSKKSSVSSEESITA